MALKRIILEMGTGNDLHGSDYTKAALRAVQDALHHSSLSVLRSLGRDPNDMQVEVTIGVQQPEKVDAAKVTVVTPPRMTMATSASESSAAKLAGSVKTTSKPA